MSWKGPLLFSMKMTADDASVAQAVCVFCADDGDAQQREAVWKTGEAQAVLLEASTGLIPDLVTLISSYFLGRFLESVPIFADRTEDSTVP